MKKILLLNLLCVTSICYSGELHWQTNMGLQSRLNCQIEAQSHSDSSAVSEYWLECMGEPIMTNNRGNQSQKGHRSFVYVNGKTFSCPVETSIFGNDAVSFFLLLDCRKAVSYKN